MARKKQYSIWITVEESTNNKNLGEMSETISETKVDEFHTKSLANAFAGLLAKYYDKELKPKPNPKRKPRFTPSDDAFWADARKTIKKLQS